MGGGRPYLSSLLVYFITLIALCPGVRAQTTQPTTQPVDIIVAADGSGQFKTITAALASLQVAEKHRVVIAIRDGVYNEQIAINRDNVTLRGQSRAGTRIEYATRGSNPTTQPAAHVGIGVVNFNGDGAVLENLAVNNTQTTHRHAMTLYGRASHVITQNCDVLSQGNDTVALWDTNGGLYYHANCRFTGNVDFLCPRGWCFVRDSSFFEVTKESILWHDGGRDPRKKLVLVNCDFDSAEPVPLGRYPRDSQFYLIGCRLSEKISDVRDDDIGPKSDFHWGRRVYYSNTHRAGGDAPWLADNLDQAAGSPKPSDITPAWAFDNRWNPERTDAPQPVSVRVDSPYRVVEVAYNEPLTVRGEPVLVTQQGDRLRWTGANGTNVLTFALLKEGDLPVRIDPGSGSITASQATATTRWADLNLPVASQP